MASNPTPARLDELIASGEDLCDGLHQHEAALPVKQNLEAPTRADLTTLLNAKAATAQATGAQPAAYAALRVADSNGKGFITASVKVLSLSLGQSWTAAWAATGLPDQRVGVPRTQDARFTALAGLKAYFTANPARENAPLLVTAAQATALHTAISNARNSVGNALAATRAATIAEDAAEEAFRTRYRAAIDELGPLLGDDDARWYDFGLNRPADPSTPGQPGTVHVTPLGSGRLLVQIDGARRANSFDYYREIVGTDPGPVKAINTPGTQYTLQGLPPGASVTVTVTGVNDAGEGLPSTPVTVVVT